MLSEKQKEAVTHVLGPALCLAGPGSGKTTVLTRRIAHLILAEKVAPEDILVITFTRAAAMEMKERFENLVGASLPVAFGTFHSVFFRILKQEQRKMRYEFIDSKKKYQIIKEACEACKFPLEQEDSLELLEKEISFMKNTMTVPENYQSKVFLEENVGEVYRYYEARKSSYGYLDFDDMLSRTYDLFEHNEAARMRWQKRFRFVLIDEAQDMNLLQYRIIKHMVAIHQNLFVVGDDDQSIYGFRGANPKILMRIKEDFEHCKVINLSTNYRCSRSIVHHAKKLIAYNEVRLEKEMQSASSCEGAIFYLHEKTKETEAEMVASKIKELGERIEWKDIAVLYRNHMECQCLAEVCQEKGIPITLKEVDKNPYQHWIILDMIAYLRMTTQVLHQRDIYRILNKPDRGLSRMCVQREWTTFDAMRSFYEMQPACADRITRLEQDVKFLKKLSGKMMLHYIRKKMGYDTYLVKRAKSKEELLEWYDILDEFAHALSGAKSIAAAIHLWEEKKLFWDKMQSQREESNRQGVGFFTLHGAKGLEFHSVFMIHCNDGIMPSKKAVTKEEVEEERRMFYVGMTRAKENLYFSYHDIEKDRKIIPSRFLLEIQGDN